MKKKVIKAYTNNSKLLRCIIKACLMSKLDERQIINIFI